MSIIISHPTSNQFNRALVMGLLDKGMLHAFYTSIASFPDNLYGKLSTVKGLQEFDRRSFDPALKEFTKMSPLTELGRMIASKMRAGALTKHEKGYFSVDAVYQNQDKVVANTLAKASKQGVDAVYAYEDGALLSFIEAKKHGIACLYDLPIGYWRYSKELLGLEEERWPEWASTLIGMKDSEAKLAKKDQELQLADRIFVASSFTARSLKEYPDKLAPIDVIPYGFPKATANRTYYSFSQKRKLKLLFVGGLSQRKGIADTFAVADKLKEYVSLTVIGRKASDECKVLDEALSRHTWIPSLPHHKVLEVMRDHDVLLFPSLFEGFGMVITEAMSQGTPVITTERTAGPDLIEDGVDGWLIEAGSTQKLQECVEKLITRPDQIIEVGKAALEKAKYRPWDVYGRELAEAIEKNRKKS